MKQASYTPYKELPITMEDSYFDEITGALLLERTWFQSFIGASTP